MGEAQSQRIPEAPEYWFYNNLLTIDQKTLFQTKVTGNEVLLAAISAFCEDNVCEKEEIYNIACRIYNLGEKSKSKDHRWVGEFQTLPDIKERFGVEQGTYLFEYIIMPLVSILVTTKSMYSKYSIPNEFTASQIAETLQQNPGKALRQTNS